MVNPLSVNSIPQELLERCIKETDNPGWKTTFQMYLEEIPHFEERLKQGPYIDMSRLATVEEIRTGKVYVASAFPTYPNHPRYTPETYILHLQNILRLMDQYENYFFLPSSAKEQQDYNLIVNEGGLALLIRTQLPPLMLEFRRPELVIACQEHLLRKADRVGCTGIQREKIRKELQALIRELRE